MIISQLFAAHDVAHSPTTKFLDARHSLSNAELAPQCSRFLHEYERRPRDGVPPRQPVRTFSYLQINWYNTVILPQVLGLPFVTTARPSLPDLFDEKLKIADENDEEKNRRINEKKVSLILRNCNLFKY